MLPGKGWLRQACRQVAASQTAKQTTELGEEGNRQSVTEKRRCVYLCALPLFAVVRVRCVVVVTIELVLGWVPIRAVRNPAGPDCSFERVRRKSVLNRLNGFCKTTNKTKQKRRQRQSEPAHDRCWSRTTEPDPRAA